MEFSFTPEQQAIRDLASDLFGAYGSDDHVRSLADRGITFDAPLWNKLAETGLLSLTLSEEHGGSNLGMVELGIILEQQGRFLSAAPLWQHQLATLCIQTHATQPLQQRLLRDFSTGAQIAAIATELDGHATLQAKQTPGGWTLNGRLAAVLLEEHQSWLLVPASTAQGPRLFCLEAKHAGLSHTQGLLTDMQPLCDIAFEQVELDADCDLGPMALEWLEPRLALCIASLQLGVLEESLRRAAAYVSERQQFGRPLGSFQALAVRAADSYIEVELLRSAQWQLAWRLDAGLPSVAAGRVAKYHAGRAGHIVGHTSQHFHGGVGADLQYPIHRYFLKSQALAMIGGGPERQLARIGRELAGQSPELYIHE